MSLSNDKNLSKLGYLDELDNSDLLKRGLVRLPVDADGVYWTGDEEKVEYNNCVYEYGSFRFCYGEGEWYILLVDVDGKYGESMVVDTDLCHHVLEKEANAFASMADELDVKALTAPYDEAGWRNYVRELANRLRNMECSK